MSAVNLALFSAERSPRYELLSAALAPEIFGHDDIKKALVLMLCGGVTKKKGDGMRLRGDIHMLMMGDPGVAKSQLLKHVCRVAPRAVYTSGKGSAQLALFRISTSSSKKRIAYTNKLLTRADIAEL